MESRHNKGMLSMPNHFSLGNLTLLQQKMVDLASQAKQAMFQ